MTRAMYATVGVTVVPLALVFVYGNDIGVPHVLSKLAKSTRLPGSLPVFYHFYPSTRFFKFLPVLGIPISKKKIKKKKLSFFCLFLPVNIGEIRELINHFRSYRP